MPRGTGTEAKNDISHSDSDDDLNLYDVRGKVVKQTFSPQEARNARLTEINDELSQSSNQAERLQNQFTTLQARKEKLKIENALINLQQLLDKQSCYLHLCDDEKQLAELQSEHDQLINLLNESKELETNYLKIADEVRRFYGENTILINKIKTKQNTIAEKLQQIKASNVALMEMANEANEALHTSYEEEEVAIIDGWENVPSEKNLVPFCSEKEKTYCLALEYYDNYLAISASVQDEIKTLSMNEELVKTPKNKLFVIHAFAQKIVDSIHSKALSFWGKIKHFFSRLFQRLWRGERQLFAENFECNIGEISKMQQAPQDIKSDIDNVDNAIKKDLLTHASARQTLFQKIDGLKNQVHQEVENLNINQGIDIQTIA